MHAKVGALLVRERSNYGAVIGGSAESICQDSQVEAPRAAIEAWLDLP
jgi:hypothetical protein